MKRSPSLRRSFVAIASLSVASMLNLAANASEPPPFPGEQSDWNGYVRHDFAVDGRQVLVVEPKAPAPGRPWVWHGEFFGHKPAPDIALLSRGFHIVYMSVPDMLGSPRAVEHWNAFYNELTQKYGFARKAALVGLSRGGLYCYNWAAANPDKVACIYGDAPVCDFKSWPGGKGEGKGSPRDWQLVVETYGFRNEAEALAYDRNPVDNLKPLAEAGVPLLHVYGDADEVVPWEENTGIIADRYREFGGTIELITKPGIGHHPHGLEDSTPIVEFIAQHASGHTIALADNSTTTLGDSTISYTVPKTGYHVLARGDVTAVIVDNRAVDDDVLAGHRAGYSGVARLTHTRGGNNLFVPSYAGLNFEHIHDGTTQDRDILFEPRKAPMELRVIDAHTAELYQAPTPTWKLESVLRYHMLDDGTIEMTLECIPRARTFRHGYIGLFWASYIHQPESLDIHFRGRAAGEDSATQWVRGVTPEHGVLSTHVSASDDRKFVHDDDFPLTLVFNRSRSVYAEPWYYGISRGMAFVQMFRPEDQIRLSQSPSGGGDGNPAWDFQWFIPNYEVGRLYRMVMRAQYLPFESPEQIQQATHDNRAALGHDVSATAGRR